MLHTYAYTRCGCTNGYSNPRRCARFASSIACTILPSIVTCYLGSTSTNTIKCSIKFMCLCIITICCHCISPNNAHFNARRRSVAELYFCTKCNCGCSRCLSRFSCKAHTSRLICKGNCLRSSIPLHTLTIRCYISSFSWRRNCIRCSELISYLGTSQISTIAGLVYNLIGIAIGTCTCINVIFSDITCNSNRGLTRAAQSITGISSICHRQYITVIYCCIISQSSSRCTLQRRGCSLNCDGITGASGPTDSITVHRGRRIDVRRSDIASYSNGCLSFAAKSISCLCRIRNREYIAIVDCVTTAQNSDRSFCTRRRCSLNSNGVTRTSIPGCLIGINRPLCIQCMICSSSNNCFSCDLCAAFLRSIPAIEGIAGSGGNRHVAISFTIDHFHSIHRSGSIICIKGNCKFIQLPLCVKGDIARNRGIKAEFCCQRFICVPSQEGIVFSFGSRGSCQLGVISNNNRIYGSSFICVKCNLYCAKIVIIFDRSNYLYIFRIFEHTCIGDLTAYKVAS